MNPPPPFVEFPKLSRLSRPCIITEKLDGTNAQILITDAGDIFTGSRTRWITPADDNFGFARWVEGNKGELIKLGPGSHFGEWWGSGIQRGYGLKEKRFSLFNTDRWNDPAVRPACCHCVPVICAGEFRSDLVDHALCVLSAGGSVAAPGFMKAEGVVIWHQAARIMLKKTIEKDSEPKSLVKAS